MFLFKPSITLTTGNTPFYSLPPLIHDNSVMKALASEQVIASRQFLSLWLQPQNFFILHLSLYPSSSFSPVSSISLSTSLFLCCFYLSALYISFHSSPGLQMSFLVLSPASGLSPHLCNTPPPSLSLPSSPPSPLLRPSFPLSRSALSINCSVFTVCGQTPGFH